MYNSTPSSLHGGARGGGYDPSQFNKICAGGAPNYFIALVIKEEHIKKEEKLKQKGGKST